MKPKRVIKWTIFNAILGYSAWLAVNGNENAGRVLIFLAWLIAVSNIAGLLIKEVKTEMRSRGRSVPENMETIWGRSLVLFLVWHGWWMTSIAILIIVICEEAIYGKQKP